MHGGDIRAASAEDMVCITLTILDGLHCASYPGLYSSVLMGTHEKTKMVSSNL